VVVRVVVHDCTAQCCKPWRQAIVTAQHTLHQGAHGRVGDGSGGDPWRSVEVPRKVGPVGARVGESGKRRSELAQLRAEVVEQLGAVRMLGHRPPLEVGDTSHSPRKSVVVDEHPDRLATDRSAKPRRRRQR
jgi:hypothetical protein